MTGPIESTDRSPRAPGVRTGYGLGRYGRRRGPLATRRLPAVVAVAVGAHRGCLWQRRAGIRHLVRTKRDPQPGSGQSHDRPALLGTPHHASLRASHVGPQDGCVAPLLPLGGHRGPGQRRPDRRGLGSGGRRASSAGARSRRADAPARRSDRSRRAAEALAASAGTDAARLAHHWTEAGDVARACSASPTPSRRRVRRRWRSCNGPGSASSC